jgi:hypothetical protein
MIPMHRPDAWGRDITRDAPKGCLMITVLIVPAFSDQGGQCRIVAAPGDYPCALDSYRQTPALWREVGIMGNDGSLVCIDPPFASLADDQPLMAGLVFKF